MNLKKTGDKGRKTEELLRAYFLRAGFFVVRGVTLRVGGADLTDIDLWVYERSATLARRRTIVDIKDKKTPQAAERLFFVKGLAEAIQVEGAGVATTDNRPALREFARRNGVLWIDGADIQRMKDSPELNVDERITEEALDTLVSNVDAGRGTKGLKESWDRIKSAVADRFGAASANTALDEAQALARLALMAHPDSVSSRVAGRITYLAAAIAAASLDFASAESALRPFQERHRQMVHALRFGEDAEGTSQRLKWAEAAIRQYAPNGNAVAKLVRDAFIEDAMAVPAENLAEIAARLTKNEALFNIARKLERAAYSVDLPTFDELDVETKGFLGAVFDFLNIDRASFAKAWVSALQNDKVAANLLEKAHPQPELGLDPDPEKAGSPPDGKLL
ncbi:hypothetical protein MHY87_07030 [Microvirga sp. ACRRW]|uniref:hypothetical protein n=1 Tax=Microvirga sp. ACRRW TaxID=2918205 RepID=UPI001EF6BB57|nr:hypothetical protein [Microvirga sp. ACRRW]MCG7392655.1 hypothetical protein [Microvirga sp. ACRRW]